MHSADRATHLKVVVVALVAGIVMAGFCVARIRSGTVFDQTAGVVKAGKPVTVSSSNDSAVR